VRKNFTGAPIPPGANSVLCKRNARVSEDGALITISRSIKLNENIRPTGNDIAGGRCYLCREKKFSHRTISLAASVGVSELIVFKKVVVGVFLQATN
jgi:molybdopterin molybdotransferase